VSSFTEGVLKAMWTTKRNISAVVVVATVAVTVGGLLAQQPLTPRPGNSAAAAEATSKRVDSAAMAETEAKLARLRELVRPKPGEHVTNIAKIAWERDPWAAAGKAAKEGKPVIAYGPGMVGLPCGYG
jgi:hypothetical protein